MVTAIVLTLVLAACGTTQPAGSSRAVSGWAAPAQAWIAGYDAAFDTASGEHAVYLAADVVVDSTALGEEQYAQGRVHAVALQREVYDGPLERADLFLGGTGVVRTESWPSAGGTRQALAWILVEDDGISRYQHAVPVADARDVDGAQVARLLDAYARAWQDGYPLAHGLYATGARFTDGIRGVHLVGCTAIADYACTNPVDPTASPPQPWTSYAYVGGNLQALQLWVRWPAAGPCGADMAAALDVGADGRVVHERRFYSLDALARCTALHEPADGWWVGRAEPLPFGDRVTGTVDGPAGTVQIRNGGPLYEQVVDWSLGQFSHAGLAAPVVSVVSFDPLDPACSGRCGLARSTPPATVLVCVDAAGLDQPSGEPRTTVPLWPARLVLHELAHLWVDQHTDPPARQQVVLDLGLPGWVDPAGPWEQQGAEWAAESLAWGLVGRPLTASVLDAPPCALLGQTFRTLTGAEPLTPCP